MIRIDFVTDDVEPVRVGHYSTPHRADDEFDVIVCGLDQSRGKRAEPLACEELVAG
jgi:hypothetical protein